MEELKPESQFHGYSKKTPRLALTVTIFMLEMDNQIIGFASICTYRDVRMIFKAKLALFHPDYGVKILGKNYAWPHSKSDIKKRCFGCWQITAKREGFMNI